MDMQDIQIQDLNIEESTDSEIQFTEFVRKKFMSGSFSYEGNIVYSFSLYTTPNRALDPSGSYIIMEMDDFVDKLESIEGKFKDREYKKFLTIVGLIKYLFAYKFINIPETMPKEEVAKQIEKEVYECMKKAKVKKLEFKAVAAEE